MAREHYGVSSTGVDLYWDSFVPTTGTSWPTVVLLHPGSFSTQANGPAGPAQDLADAGFLALTAEYRLAPFSVPMKVSGGHEPQGQDTVVPPDTGHYPKQTDDVGAAIAAARLDSRNSTGKVYVIGFGAGASHAAYIAATGTQNTTKPDLVVLLSIMFSNFGDPNLLALAAVPGNVIPHDVITNYIGITDTWPTYSPTDLATLTAASPVTYMTGNMPPLYTLMSSRDNLGVPTSMGIAGQSDAGPPETVVDGGLIPKLLSPAVGMLETIAPIPQLARFKKLVVPVGGFVHDVQLWSKFVNGTSGQRVSDSIITWLLAGVPDPAPPPPPATSVLRGAVFAVGNESVVDPLLLTNPNVDGIAIVVRWRNLEPTEGAYDFLTYLIPTIKTIAAAGKRVTINIVTMGGSATFDGNTPNWVFTAIGSTFAGNPRNPIDGVTVNGSATVTSATAAFNDADLHQPISGANIPAASYVGIVNSLTSIGLSSSPTANTPVNATGDGDPVVLTLPSRPRVANDTHDLVHGATFTYNDPSPNHPPPPLSTIPVYWEPTFVAKKKKMLNAVGNELTYGSLLTATEKAAIAVIRVGYANAQTEDWNVPNGIDPTDPAVNWNDLWLNSPTAPIYANRGAGYTTQRMIDLAVKRGDETFATGQTFTSKRLVSGSALFMWADVGKAITGTGIPAGTTIATWTSTTEVQLSQATTATATGVPFTIHARDTGILDIVVRAFPGKLVETAINSNGPVLDAAAAALEGDTDIHNFLPRKVSNLVNVKWPAQVVITKNSVTAIMPIAPPVGTTGNVRSWGLIYELGKQHNFYVGAQNAFRVFLDAAYRMNGGSAEDKDHPGVILTDAGILQRCGERVFGYGVLYLEIYAADGVAPEMAPAVKFIHDLLTATAPPPPPPPPPGAELPPFHAPIRTTTFADLIAGIAGLLSVDLESDLSPSIARTWFAAINRHTRYAWEFWPWPELYVTEERAFRVIWNSEDQYVRGEEVFYLETFSYFRALTTPDIDPPIGTRPTDDRVWAAISLTDRYVQLDQRCRQAIGQIMGVYEMNPYQLSDGLYCGCPPPPPSLWFTMSERGIEVPGGGITVFLHYKIRPSRFDSKTFESGIAYGPGVIIYSPALGDCFRSLLDVTGISPETDTAGTHWALVPMPYVISDFVMYATAADMAESQQQKAGFLTDAERVLVRETDKTIEQDPTQRISTNCIAAYGAGRNFRPSGPPGAPARR